jgi:3-(3-hydroxy-phenyl)propionate hydroxylase
MSSNADIVVVGAGPTGLTLACQLLRRGVPCRLIDQSLEPSSRSRAIGVSPRTLEVFDELGAADELIELGVVNQAANFYSGGRHIGRVNSTGVQHTKYPFMLAVPQSVTEQVLERRLNKLGGAVERGVRLHELHRDQVGVRMVLDGPSGTEPVESRWVVGADGAHSTVRTLAGIGFSATTTDDVYINVDAYVDDGPTMGEGHYHFSPGALTVLVGISAGLYRITAMVDPSDFRSAEIGVRDVETLVSGRIERDLKIRELRNPGWGIARVRIQTGIADTFRAGRCLLAGDAAHVYGPVGAQGMNAGVQDAHNLAWKLALVSTSKAGELLMDSYDPERRRAANAAMHHSSSQARMATVRPKAARAFRDLMVSGLAKSGVLDRRYISTVTQFALDYRGIPGTAGKRPGSGKRIPDMPLDGGAAETNGARTLPSRIFNVLSDRALTVLMLAPEKATGTQLSTVTGELARRFGDLVAVVPLWRAGAANGGLIDGDGRLHKHLRVSDASVCVVRPDAHVGYQGPLSASSALFAYLETVLSKHSIQATSVS